jgi:hypothetical protein
MAVKDRLKKVAEGAGFALAMSVLVKALGLMFLSDAREIWKQFRGDPRKR